MQSNSFIFPQWYFYFSNKYMVYKYWNIELAQAFLEMFTKSRYSFLMDTFPAKNYMVSQVEGEGVGLLGPSNRSPQESGAMNATPRKMPWYQFPREFAEEWTDTAVKHPCIKQVPQKERGVAPGHCALMSFFSKKRHADEHNYAVRESGKVCSHRLQSLQSRVTTCWFSSQWHWLTQISSQGGAIYTLALR